MGFEELPTDLKNLVCGFAYAQNWSKTKSSLQTCEKIASYNISPVFLRLQMWSWAYCAFLPNPLNVFEPICQYTGRWSDMVDWHAVNELMHRLDFRRRIVRMGGTRRQWFRKFKENWLNIVQFDTFYRVMLHSGVKCFKPTYEVVRLEQLSEFRSPFQSARWLLEDFCYWTS